MTVAALERFVIESNAIEGINREPTAAEIEAHVEFLRGEVSVAALERFVDVVQPGTKLRRLGRMNVRVGNHVAPPGGPEIVRRLADLLYAKQMSAYRRHQEYERLHPFMDGNGRSGRALWLHDMGGIKNVPLGFLHTWYYQSLAAGRG